MPRARLSRAPSLAADGVGAVLGIVELAAASIVRSRGSRSVARRMSGASVPDPLQGMWASKTLSRAASIATNSFNSTHLRTCVYCCVHQRKT